MELRLKAVEEAVSTMRLRLDDVTLKIAVRDERDRHIDEKLVGLQNALDAMQGSIRKLMWMVAGAVISGGATWLFQGGLFPPGIH